MASKKQSSGKSAGSKAAKGRSKKSSVVPPPPSDLELSSPSKNKKGNETTTMLAGKARRGDKGAEEALKRITASFEKRNRAKEKLSQARSDRSKALAESAEGLRQAMEIAVEATAENTQLDEALKRKLRRIEQAWQTQEEQKAFHLEEVRDAQGDLKRAEKLLEESVVEGRQLRLIA